MKKQGQECAREVEREVTREERERRRRERDGGCPVKINLELLRFDTPSEYPLRTPPPNAPSSWVANHHTFPGDVSDHPFVDQLGALRVTRTDFILLPLLDWGNSGLVF